MTYDPIAAHRELAPKRRFDPLMLIALIAVVVLSLGMSMWETRFELTDFHVHMMTAHAFDFTDLHSITSRLAYPMWHLLVSILYQLGASIEWAAAIVTAACRAVTFVLVYEMITVMSGCAVKSWIVTLLTLALMIVTALHLPFVSYFVYMGVGSPNVWHSPTQQAVIAAAMMVMPWLAHCWYEFERQIGEGKTGVMLPWWKIIVLAVLCMGNLACKPTFMQALFPAAFVMYAVEVFRHPREWRYFGQIILAFVPAAAYFLLQYLYYTGVVVEFTSGVAFGVTAEAAWLAVRNTLMMSAAPLAAVVVCYRKGMFKDRMLVLALLMTLFSVLEAMAFRETGMREGHGNFNWAAGSSSFFLWVVMAGVFLRTAADDWKSRKVHPLKWIGYAVVIVLFLHHVYSGGYYLHFLLTTNNAF